MHRRQAAVGVRRAKAWAMAACRASRVRAWACRTAPVTVPPHGAIGDRSGASGGHSRTRAGRPARRCGSPPAGGPPQGSSPPRSPGLSGGPQPCRPEGRQPAIAVAPSPVMTAWLPCPPSAPNRVTGWPSGWGTAPRPRAPLGARPSRRVMARVPPDALPHGRRCGARPGLECLFGRGRPTPVRSRALVARLTGSPPCWCRWRARAARGAAGGSRTPGLTRATGAASQYGRRPLAGGRGVLSPVVHGRGRHVSADAEESRQGPWGASALGRGLEAVRAEVNGLRCHARQARTCSPSKPLQTVLGTMLNPKSYQTPWPHGSPPKHTCPLRVCRSDDRRGGSLRRCAAADFPRRGPQPVWVGRACPRFLLGRWCARPHHGRVRVAEVARCACGDRSALCGTRSPTRIPPA
jgi:hypothetical protein